MKSLLKANCLIFDNGDEPCIGDIIAYDHSASTSWRILAFEGNKVQYISTSRTTSSMPAWAKIVGFSRNMKIIKE